MMPKCLQLSPVIIQTINTIKPKDENPSNYLNYPLIVPQKKIEKPDNGHYPSPLGAGFLNRPKRQRR